MPTLIVHVLNDDQEPMEYSKVFLMIHHNFMPDTWLEERTDSEGETEFDVPQFTKVDVYVDGELEIENIDIGDEDDHQDVTVTISNEDDDE